MVTKGDNKGQESILSAEAFVDSLSPIGGVTSKKMFGGHGLFHDDKMFGLLSAKGQYFMKADDSNLADYEADNCERHSRMPYWNVPDDVLKNTETLNTWVRKSIAASK